MKGHLATSDIQRALDDHRAIGNYLNTLEASILDRVENGDEPLAVDEGDAEIVARRLRDLLRDLTKGK